MGGGRNNIKKKLDKIAQRERERERDREIKRGRRLRCWHIDVHCCTVRTTHAAHGIIYIYANLTVNTHIHVDYSRAEPVVLTWASEKIEKKK